MVLVGLGAPGAEKGKGSGAMGRVVPGALPSASVSGHHGRSVEQWDGALGGRRETGMEHHTSLGSGPAVPPAVWSWESC